LSKGKGTTIDLVWANLLGSKLVAATSVLNNNFGSDHQEIRVHLALKPPESSSHLRLPNWKELDKRNMDTIAAELLSLSSKTLTNKLTT
jgi:hypothetical protein